MSASSESKRRRSRLAAIVPPVPPPRITICFLAICRDLLLCSQPSSAGGRRHPRLPGMGCGQLLSCVVVRNGISAAADVTRVAPGDDRGTPTRRQNMAVSHTLPDDLVALIAERFRALSEPTRIGLLDRRGEGEASVLELTDAIGTTEQNVSKHLGVLHRAGIVARRRQGNFVYYSILDVGVFELCDSVCGGLREQVDSLRRVVAGARTS